MFVSDTTGVVDLSASTPGTYTITNTVITESCGLDTLSSSVTIIINPAPVGNFSYPGTPFCNDAGSAPISLDPGSETGTFSATPAGLSINAATGTVNVAASSPGTYTVTNTIPAGGGCDEDYFTTTIEIFPGV